jgi:zinc transport system substrate-binding protein
MKRILAWSMLLALLAWSPALAAGLPVVASIGPQKYFLEQIAGPLVQVSVMAPPGADPHTFEPKPSQMAQMAKARLYMAQGVEFEAIWLPKLTTANSGLTVVRTTDGIPLLPLEEGGHEHGSGHGRHAESEFDVHTWTAPPLVKIQVAAMAKALCQADPANAQTYTANLAAFSARLDALDAQIRQILAPVPPGSRFMVFHPAWAYFARQYNLVEVPIETGGKEPGPRQLKTLAENAKAQGVKVIFVQPQFSAKTAEILAQAVGAAILPADDLAENWEENLLNVAKAFRDAVR